MDEKNIFIIAGANGSGKSTLASELLPEEKLKFLNADEIAKEICPENITKVRITAGKNFLQKLDKLLTEKSSFAIETTLSGNNHIKTILKAKEEGYNIVLIYSFVDNPNICINRIKARVMNGGHNVPDEDVIRRFYRSKNNFWNKYKDIVDRWAIYYNGELNFIQIAKGEDKHIEILDELLYNEFKKDIKL